MQIVDTELEKLEARGTPIRIGIVGAGYMGRSIALQLLTPLAGMRLVAVANRTLSRARQAYREGGAAGTVECNSLSQLDEAIARGRPAITGDAQLLCRSENIDVLIEVTGTIDAGAAVVLAAIEHRKHVVLVNAELDATIGPILKIRADRAGVVLTNTDGDEPGVAMNLYRFVKSIGYQPVLAGNIKGFINPYRTPDTQREFAAKHHQEPRMITSFADGTKLSMEATILANATGFGVAKRGMHGYSCSHVNDILAHFTPEMMLEGGFVEYVLGAEPGTGAFVVGYNEHPAKRQLMRYFKMGEGPLYVFYTPYHLPHLQVANTVARAACFHDAAVAPLGQPSCDVVTIAKRNLKAGEILDGIGGFLAYGMIDNVQLVQSQRLLPMGLSEGCVLRRDVPQDAPLSYDDVKLPPGRLCDRLRTEQDAHFFATAETTTPRNPITTSTCSAEVNFRNG